MKYTLVGVNGNAFAIMSYTANAMRECGLNDKVDEMYKRATTSDYNHLINVCDSYIQRCNELADNY